jgi:hypothetical protein
MDRFIEVMSAEIGASADGDSLERYFQAAPPDQMYLGFERYWAKKAEREAVK